MKKLRLAITLLVICGMLAGCSRPQRESIVVGSKDFTEQHILGYVLTLLIEANTDLDVTYRSNMASHVIFAAIRTGAVDVVADYAGTVYGYYLGFSYTRAPGEVLDISARELGERYNLLMLDPLGFNNTFALAIKPGAAAEYNIKTFSDLAEVSYNFIFSGSAEIISRNDGLPNLQRVYGMRFKETRVAHEIERYAAIMSGEVQVTEVFATDGMIKEYDLVVLEDDKNALPPYYGVIIIRGETAEKHPELLEILGRLAGMLSDDIMRGLNYRVDVLDENPKDVAESFLRNNNFIK